MEFAKHGFEKQGIAPGLFKEGFVQLGQGVFRQGQGVFQQLPQHTGIQLFQFNG